MWSLPDEPTDPTPGVCEWCRGEITGRRAGARYCTDSHRVMAAKRRTREAEGWHSCAYCDTLLVGRRSDARYCDHMCRSAFNAMYLHVARTQSAAFLDAFSGDTAAMIAKMREGGMPDSAIVSIVTGGRA